MVTGGPTEKTVRATPCRLSEMVPRDLLDARHRRQMWNFRSVGLLFALLGPRPHDAPGAIGEELLQIVPLAMELVLTRKIDSLSSRLGLISQPASHVQGE